MDPDSLEQAIIDATKSGFRPSVVISVDLFGQPSNYPAIKKIADQAGAKVLIDGAQSFGASLEGHIVGSMGDATTTSFSRPSRWDATGTEGPFSQMTPI